MSIIPVDAILPFLDRIEFKNKELNNIRISAKKTLKQEQECSAKIYSTLNNSSKILSSIKLDRISLVGSKGKDTSLPGSDVDLVVFIDNEFPPFGSILQLFGQELKKSACNIKIFKADDHSIRMSIDEVNINLYAATNFAKNAVALRGQLHGALNFIYEREDPFKESFFYNTSIAEYSTKFVAQRSKFNKDIILLAKAWDRSIEIKHDIPGRSHLIELVAIHANKKQKAYRNVFIGFLRFLMEMAQFQSLHIEFGFSQAEQKKIGINNLHINIPYPKIIDPVNPWINLALGVSEEAANVFTTEALKTIEKMKTFKNMSDIIIS